MRKVLLLFVAAAALYTIYAFATDGSRTDRATGILGGDRSFTFEYRFTIEDIPLAANKVAAWIPVPRSDAHQDIGSIRVSDGLRFESLEETEYGNQFYYFDLTEIARQNGFATVTVRYDVARRPQRLRASGADKETQRALAPFLEPDRLVPTHGAIAEEARRVAGDQLDKYKNARALYDHIVETVRYDKSGSGWGKGDALYACDARAGNCTDFHSLFIGEARALDIPARFLMGFPVSESASEGAVGGYHCWAEFYVEGRGWLPIDASEAYKHPEKREAFFGGLDANRVAVTRGRDVRIPNAHTEPLNYVIYPHVEVDDVTHSNVSTEFSFVSAGDRES